MTPTDERLRNALQELAFALKARCMLDPINLGKRLGFALRDAEAALSALDARASQSSLGDLTGALRQGAAGAPSESQR